MKKLNTWLIIAITIFSASCTKENSIKSENADNEKTQYVSQSGSKDNSEKDNAIESKSLSLESLLLSIGTLGVYELEDELIELCPLNENELKLIINETLIPDYLVETLLLLSAPVTNNSLDELISSRPEFNSTTLIANRDKSFVGNQFIIFNSANREIFFGTQIEVVSGDCVECGEKNYRITNYQEVSLSNAFQVNDDVLFVRPCRNGNRNWVCGTATNNRIISSGGNTVIIETRCSNSTDRCVHRVSSALN